MKGSVHAAIGASAPIGLVVTQYANPIQGFAMAAVAAGFSLLPDIDHPRSCASKALGSPVHRIVHRMCKSVVDGTATGRDRSQVAWKISVQQDPYHRTLTHTLAASISVGLVVYAAAWIGLVVMAAIASFGVFLLWPLYRKTIGLVVLAAALTAVATVMLLSPWLLALAAFAGYFSHVIADGCTKAGVPLLWPMEMGKPAETKSRDARQGARWWRIHLMGKLIESGSEREKGPAVGVAAVSNALLLLLTL